MTSRRNGRTYGTVSAEKQNEMTGLEFVQGLADGTLPLNTIAETLGYDIVGKHTRKAAEECSERGGQATRSIWSLMISRRFWRPNSVKAMVSRPPTSWIQSIPSSGSS